LDIEVDDEPMIVSVNLVENGMSQAVKEEIWETRFEVDARQLYCN